MWRRENDIQVMLRDSATRFLSANHAPKRIRNLRGNAPGYQPEFWTEMAGMGWCGVMLSEADGGSDLGLDPALTLCHCLGENLVPEPFVSNAVVAATLLKSGAGDAARTARAEIAAGTRIVLPALADRLPELARSGDSVTLSGHVRMVPDWSDDASVVVAATGADGVALMILPDATPISCTRMADGTYCADLAFDEVPVPTSAIVSTGAAAAKALSEATCYGLLGLSAYLEGLSKSLMEMTISYVRQREQFDRPLAAFQAMRHGIVDMDAQYELASASWRQAARRVADLGVEEAEGDVLLAKARAGRAATFVGRGAIQYHGAIGFTEDADVGLYYNAVLRNAARMGADGDHRLKALDLYRRKAAADA